jgi:hypothetical protein
MKPNGDTLKLVRPSEKHIDIPIITGYGQMVDLTF